jgi:sarcosine oxidase
VFAVEPDGAGVRVVTDRETIAAGCAVVAAGAWVTSLVRDVPLPVRVTRQVLGWFEPVDTAQAGLFAPDRFPVFLLQNRDGIYYGFPADGSAGVKVATHVAGATVDPDHYDRSILPRDEATIRAALKAHLPGADGRLITAKTCLYTVSPDGDFILDRLPSHPQIVVASPCSGHGFKFAPIIGEILADLAMMGATAHDISRFSLARFS